LYKFVFYDTMLGILQCDAGIFYDAMLWYFMMQCWGILRCDAGIFYNAMLRYFMMQFQVCYNAILILYPPNPEYLCWDHG